MSWSRLTWTTCGVSRCDTTRKEEASRAGTRVTARRPSPRQVAGRDAGTSSRMSATWSTEILTAVTVFYMAVTAPQGSISSTHPR